MSPLELMQRPAALVPRPRLQLIRGHGVRAPNAQLRARGVPLMSKVPKVPKVPEVFGCVRGFAAPLAAAW